MENILENARQLLESHFHTKIEFEASQKLDSQFSVLRLSLATDALPKSIIVKQIPADARFGGVKRLLSEWAALEFVKQLKGDFAPRLILGDVDSGILITEDLGSVPSLQDILSENDAQSAKSQLIAYGRFLGEMQAASFGREAEFLAIQKRLGAETPPNDSSLDLRQRQEAVQRCLSLTNWDKPEALIAEIGQFSAAMHDESPLRVFTHHDAGPHNILLTAQGIRFVDFEFARYEHALLDVTALRLAFPPFSHGRRIPIHTVLAYENSYRQAAALGMPSLLDEKIYAQALELACAKWLITKVIGFFTETYYPLIVCNDWSNAPKNASPENITYNRRMVYTWLWTYLESFSNYQHLPISYSFLSKTAETMRQHNPDLQAFEYYTAFH